MPLARILSAKSGAALTSTTLGLALGLSASHALVPPTPGPVLAAAQLHANLGLVLGFGAVVAIVSAGVGVIFSVAIAPRLVADSELAGVDGVGAAAGTGGRGGVRRRDGAGHGSVHTSLVRGGCWSTPCPC